jgi:hypothetical protein
MVVGVVHTCHTLSMHHITQQCVWSSMSIWVSLSLDHYALTDGHKSTYFGVESRYHKRVKHVGWRVLIWSLGLFTPVTHCPCII